MNKQNLQLKDMRCLKNTIEKEMTLFTYVDFIARYLKVPLDFWIGFAEMLQPDFIEVDGMVVIEELYKEKGKDLVRYGKENMSIKDMEYWMNLICMDSYLSYLGNTGSFDPYAQRYLLDKVRHSWDMKLRHDFPQKQFIVKIIDDDMFGDLMVTFFQA